jgi:clan AA aspartic protease (TIGR02281 family)
LFHSKVKGIKFLILRLDTISDYMKKLFKTLLIVIFFVTQVNLSKAQTVVKMEKSNGIYLMPCKVNGLSLKFIFDTGASNVSISLTEALFMLKNGYLSKNDLKGTEYYTIANGDIEEGTSVRIDLIEIGKVKLYNVEASISHNLNAPLLLGQSALSKLERIEFNYTNNTLTIFNGPDDYVADNSSSESPQSNNQPKAVYNYAEKGAVIKLKNQTIIYSEPYIISKELVKSYGDEYAVIVGFFEQTEYYKISYRNMIGFIKKDRIERTIKY